MHVGRYHRWRQVRLNRAGHDVARLQIGIAGELEITAGTVEIAGLLELAEKLHIPLDLWAAQNRLWDAAHELDLDPDQLARLSRALWFDERTLANRALLVSRLVHPPPRAAAS